jgi:hypothetical protein
MNKPLQSEYDVFVTGGGPAGICAAIQSARAGARTLLVEKNGMLGGTTTSAGVNFPGLFHAWGKQVIGGIGWELVSSAAQTSGDELPNFAEIPDRHWKHQVWVNRAVYASIAAEKAMESGVHLLLHAMPAACCANEEHVELTVCAKEGLRTFRAQALVDCTGDANALTMAGCETVRHDQRQPGTLIVQLGGYRMEDFDEEAADQALHQALEAGELLPGDVPNGVKSVRRLLVQQGNNALDVLGVDGRTSEGRTAAEISARKQFLRIYRFLKRLPAMEMITAEYMAPECGIRETVTIKGRDTVLGEDYLAGRNYPDAICYSFYPIDWHKSDGRGIEKKYLPEGVVAKIPFGALVPRRARRLLAAGRCLSSDQMANSALRVQATSMATGQAAGAAAALAAGEGSAVADVDASRLRKFLNAHGAIVPEEA